MVYVHAPPGSVISSPLSARFCIWISDLAARGVKTDASSQLPTGYTSEIKNASFVTFKALVNNFKGEAEFFVCLFFENLFPINNDKPEANKTSHDIARNCYIGSKPVCLKQ